MCCCVLEGNPRALSPFSVDPSNPRWEFLPPPLPHSFHSRRRPTESKDRTRGTEVSLEQLREHACSICKQRPIHNKAYFSAVERCRWRPPPHDWGRSASWYRGMVWSHRVTARIASRIWTLVFAALFAMRGALVHGEENTVSRVTFL